MRALTLTQPWAGLVASGLKLVENRPRSILRREDFGQRFALHASRVIDEPVYRRIREIAPELHLDEHLTEEQLPLWYRLSRVTSAVIGVATVERAVIEWRDGSIVDRHGVNGGPVVDLGDQRRWFFGEVGYVLRDVQPLAEPVPCRGALGFWTLPAEVAARVEELLR
jgi:hypothetical protein